MQPSLTLIGASWTRYGSERSGLVLNRVIQGVRQLLLVDDDA